MNKQLKKTKNKFELKKFEIVRLNNLKTINGGNAQAQEMSDDVKPTIKTF